MIILSSYESSILIGYGGKFIRSQLNGDVLKSLWRQLKPDFEMEGFQEDIP